MDDTTLMAEREEELRGLLMKMKEENEKAGWKLDIPKTNIMATGPITPWQIDGEKVETMTEFIFLGSKLTVDSDCSHEIKKILTSWKKSYDKASESVSRLVMSNSGTPCTADLQAPLAMEFSRQ